MKPAKPNRPLYVSIGVDTSAQNAFIMGAAKTEDAAQAHRDRHAVDHFSVFNILADSFARELHAWLKHVGVEPADAMELARTLVLEVSYIMIDPKVHLEKAEKEGRVV